MTTRTRLSRKEISEVASARCLPGILLGFLALLTGCGEHAGTSTAAEQSASLCSFERATPSADGITRLALLVGVGAYNDASIRDLAGPANDVANMHALLTGNGGYGFPEKNVCRLADAQATGQQFRDAFRKALLDRATQGAVLVVYFAGHGTQISDDNDDEPDPFDEALMLADSRQTPEGNLRDDELFDLLESARKASGNVVMIMDACTSGSATRATEAGLIARFQPPRPQDLNSAKSGTSTEGDRADSWVPQARPGLVVMAAAVDGTSAIETNGAGVFTNALVGVLSQVSAAPITYAQVGNEVPPLLSARSGQVPAFEGGADKIVFGAASRNRPAALVVRKVGTTVKLGGTLMPGLGRGAELRVFDSNLSGAEFRDPAKSKAILTIESISGPNAEARIASQPTGAPALKAGDLAVMLRPSDDTITLRVRIRPEKELNGVPAARVPTLRKAITENLDLTSRIELTDSLQDFELASDYLGRIAILGPEGRTRHAVNDAAEVATELRLHARQRAFLNLSSEPGTELKNDDTLRVQIEQSGEPSPCTPKGLGLARNDAGTWIMPLCTRWKMSVSLAPGVATPLQVGGLILSSDGSIYGFPGPNARIVVRPEDKAPVLVLDGAEASIPIGIDDHILVFGTKESNPVDWHRLTQAVAERGPGDAQHPPGPLFRAIDAYVSGARGQKMASTRFEDTAWTRTLVSMRVEANPRFEPQTSEVAVPGSREYTIKGFDIRPYLPDDATTPLHKLLGQTQTMAAGNYPYDQHEWLKKFTDEQNLAKGIDCTRAIWYAFRKAGLKYNDDDRYLQTAAMVGTDTHMKEMFDQCPANEDLQIGDVLVYRDAGQGDGHAVIVIDPLKRIAWGSHGWDGNAKKFKVAPETGVEYQLIKMRRDWQKWDRPTMELSACWRYRPFAEARARGEGRPGTAALENSCEPQYCAAIPRSAN